MPFINKLNIQHIEGTEDYLLLTSLVYIDKKGKKWVVDEKFRSDGHSIPPLLRSFAGSPFATKFPKSAWFHDDWCRSGIIPRREADKKYKELLKEEGATKFQQIRNYLGVRVMAGMSWISRQLPWNRRKKLKKND